MNPAPPKPPAKNADRKAILAYHSELRRWAEALRRWEADLDRRENNLIDFSREEREAMDDGDTMVDDDGDEMDCDCTSEEAEAGCDCPSCEKWRSDRAKAMMKSQQAAVKAGDEVQWLEELWNLPDRRRKKK